MSLVSMRSYYAKLDRYEDYTIATGLQLDSAGHDTLAFSLRKFHPQEEVHDHDTVASISRIITIGFKTRLQKQMGGVIKTTSYSVVSL